jgi:uncharacterized damage-inducible protein DinB
MLAAMVVPVDVLRTHVRYTSWASARMVDAASRLSSEELTRDFKHATAHVLGTLAHVYAADRAWLRRIEGAPPAPLIDPDEDIQLATLELEWPALLGRWQAWVDALQDPAASASYKDFQGNPHITPYWQIVLHVVNHGTHHRGQAAAMLRAMGHAPPPLDLIRYYREAGHRA